MNEHVLDWVRGFGIDFDLTTGLSPDVPTHKRYLSQMKGMYSDSTAFDAEMAKGDPLIYEFHEIGAPEIAGDLAFGCSIVYPGTVGNEYYMTKGHFHTILETAEIYFCLSGFGYMLLESPEGDWSAQELTPGKVVYVPKRYAHRSINAGSEIMRTFFVFRADAGHDYGTIETKGYRKLCIEQAGKPVFVDNPKWR